MNIVQTLWSHGSFSTLEKLCAVSFMKNGYEFHLYHYGEIENVPNGVIMKDGNEIMPYIKFEHHAQFADMFRYKLLHDKGGWWVDADEICLQRILFEKSPIIWCRETENGFVSNAIMYAEKGSEIMLDLYRQSCVISEKEKISYLSLGPPMVTKYVNEKNLFGTLVSTKLLCPIKGEACIWPFSEGAIRDRIEEYVKNSFTIHMWKSRCLHIGINFNAEYNGSFYERIKRKYGIIGDGIKAPLIDHLIISC